MNSNTKTVYHDNLFDRLFIALFSRKMAQVVGKKNQKAGYEGFVELSFQIMRGRNADEQQRLVAQVLQSLLPSLGLKMVRTFFSPTQWVCEWNAWFATKMFEWLVGPSQVQYIEVTTENGEKRSQKSQVYIEKCRYLEESGCVGMCINMCKLPTQKFFTEEFGIPLTMIPDFNDFSCKMIFGQVPPPLTEEEAYNQPCLTHTCNIAQADKPCPKVRE
jgi:Beta-carotene isomerase D27-like, C-terminal